jgi:hypothetical protein
MGSRPRHHRQTAMSQDPMLNALPIVIVEVVMVFGGVLLFAWWQLRSIRKDRERAAEEQRSNAAQATPESVEGCRPRD